MSLSLSMESRVEVKWETENESALITDLNLIASVFGIISCIKYKYFCACKRLWISKCNHEVSETGYYQNCVINSEYQKLVALLVSQQDEFFLFKHFVFIK